MTRTMCALLLAPPRAGARWGLRTGRLALVLAVALAAAAPVRAGEAEEGPFTPGALTPDAFTLRAGIGLATLAANEYFYGFDGTRLSRLDWRTDALPLARFEAEWRGAPAWVVTGAFELALPRDGYLEDYDWLVPGRDWSHRSRSVTTLDRYFALDFGLRWEALRRERWMLGLAGGVRYSEVRWTDSGGDFVYSSGNIITGPGGFRDLVFSEPPGEKGISYEQRMPALYLGPAARLPLGPGSLSASAVGGFSFAFETRDDHWQRRLTWEREMSPAPYLALAGRLDWPLGAGASLFLGGRYERFFEARGSMTITDHATGDFFVMPQEISGATFQSARVDAGFSVRF